MTNAKSKKGHAATPALDVVQAAGVGYSVHRYEHDPAHESFGMEAAEKLGIDPERVFKTLIAQVDGKLIVGIVPVDRSLDLKALAAAAGGKSATMAEIGAAQRVTGYVAGAISPLGQKKQLPTYIDVSAKTIPAMLVSGGRRGLDIELAADDLANLTSAEFASISR